jgi:hypothetical protein
MMAGWGELAILGAFLGGLVLGFAGQAVLGSQGYDLGLAVSAGLFAFCFVGLVYSVLLRSNASTAMKRMREQSASDGYSRSLLDRARARNTSVIWQGLIGAAAVACYALFQMR